MLESGLTINSMCVAAHVDVREALLLPLLIMYNLICNVVMLTVSWPRCQVFSIHVPFSLPYKPVVWVSTVTVSILWMNKLRLGQVKLM